MSCCVVVSTLTREQKLEMAKKLSIREKETFYNKGKTSVVKMFRKYEDKVYIPFNFYFTYFNKFPNCNIDFPEVDFKFKGNLLERQISVVEEAEQILAENRSLILQLRPGFGKSATSTYLASRLKVVTLILHDRVILEDQWINNFNKLTDALVWVIGKKPPLTYNVIICSNRKYLKIPEEIRIQIGCIIIDECHKFCTVKGIPLLMTFTPKYLIALSATIKRNNGLEKMLFLECGEQNIVRRRNEVAHTTYKVRTGITLDLEGATSIWNEMVKQQMNSIERNEMVYHLLDSFVDKKVCILTMEIDHSDLIYNELKKRNYNVAIMVGKAKNYSDSKILVGTVSKLGTAFDEENCCKDFQGIRIDTLILLTSNKSEGIIEQILGRAFRAQDPEIYSFVDNHRISKDHWNELKKWSSSNKGIIKEYKFNNKK